MGQKGLQILPFPHPFHNPAQQSSPIFFYMRTPAPLVECGCQCLASTPWKDKTFLVIEAMEFAFKGLNGGNFATLRLTQHRSELSNVPHVRTAGAPHGKLKNAASSIATERSAARLTFHKTTSHHLKCAWEPVETWHPQLCPPPRRRR